MIWRNLFAILLLLAVACKGETSEEQSDDSFYDSRGEFSYMFFSLVLQIYVTSMFKKSEYPSDKDKLF